MAGGLEERANEKGKRDKRERQRGDRERAGEIMGVGRGRNATACAHGVVNGSVVVDPSR